MRIPRSQNRSEGISSIEDRREEKVLSRLQDRKDLRRGVSPEVIQQRNSVMPRGVAKRPMSNLLESLGR